MSSSATLELKIRGGWIAGVYQWSGMESRWPGLRVPLDDDPESQRAAVLAIHPDAQFRWPGEAQSPVGQRKIA